MSAEGPDDVLDLFAVVSSLPITAASLTDATLQTFDAAFNTVFQAYQSAAPAPQPGVAPRQSLARVVLSCAEALALPATAGGAAQLASSEALLLFYLFCRLLE
jgi:hypothetical protein